MWNDKETDVDLLGHDKLAQTVIEIIEDNHLRPLTIGVYGDWGVGKSSILSLLHKKIAETNRLGITKTHCIIFNGWLFQGYEDAKSALMESIVAELAALQPRHKKIQKLATSLIRRVNWLKVAKATTGAIFTGLTGIPDPTMFGGLVGMLKKGKNLLSPEKAPGETNITVEAEDSESFLKDYEEDTITGQIQAFRKEFKQLIDASKVDHIIVLVDDLDRCLPKSVIEILEAIRLFLFVEGTTFVLSADERMIEYAVREHFPNLPASYSDYTKNYLEKLIQIPIRIPTLNRLQTGNYIKFLLLQFHLKHNYAELAKVYEFYNKKKKTPYEPVELSHQIITEALGANDTNLNESILVGDQLSPTLSIGLKGNPRNIKRFLNTLFLRLRIARIYGLDSVIKLNVLAKLMLLERFQPEQFNALVDEVSLTQNGISERISKFEEDKTNRGEETEASDSDLKFTEWIHLEPQLSKADLHPYIFISREKAIGFDTDSAFPSHLTALLEQLSGTSDIALQTAQRNLQGVQLSDAILLFNKLEAECRTISDVKDIPPPMKGLLRIVAVHQDLEPRIIQLIDTYPVKALGIWALAQLSGIKGVEGKKHLKELYMKFANQTENKPLKGLAEQALKQA